MVILAVFFGLLELFFIRRFDAREGGFRVQKSYNWIEPDDQLMWRPRAYDDAEFTWRNKDGSSYSVHYRTGRYGFREWGDPESPRKKIFVIGDSFTHAPQISNEKTYYHLLGNQLNAEIFAFGVSAYGTLQEWMILDHYLGEIKPDLILWQFCANDFYDNLSALSHRSVFLDNPKRMRPFLEDGGIVYRREKFLIEWFYEIKRSTPSRFLYFVATRLLTLMIGEPLQGWTRGREPDAKAMESSRKTTMEIFRKVAETAGPIPVYLFSTAEYPPAKTFLEKSAEENHFHFLTGIRPALDEAASQGRIVHEQDGVHWNEQGHEIAAEVLTSSLRTK